MKSSSPTINKIIFKEDKLIYPVFTLCLKHIKDDFWKNFFSDLSYGKHPKCIYINNNTIFSSNKKRNFSFAIPKYNTHKSDDYNIDSKKIYIDLKNLLLDNTPLCSPIDIAEKKEKLKNSFDEEITNETSWNEIKKKNVRDIFIIKYVIRMKEEYNLNWDKARNLYSIIQLAFIYKTHTSKDILFMNKQIEEIQDIIYDDKQGHFNNIRLNDDFILEDEITEEKTKKYLTDYWEKYVISTIKK